MFPRCVASFALATLVLGASAASAQSHLIGDGFVVLNANGAGNAYFDTDLLTANPDYAGVVATISPGQSLRLGGEVETFATSMSFAGNGYTLQADVVALLYSINGAPAQSLNLPYRTHPDGILTIDRWDEVGLALMPDIAPLLSAGTNELTITFTSQDFGHPVAPGITKNLGPYTAQVVLTPEPASLAIVGVTAALSLRRRRAAR